MRLTRKAIADLRRLCEWLDAAPRRAFYPSVVAITVKLHGLAPYPEECSYWLEESHRQQRKQADVIFWGTGWGWRLRKNWRQQLEQLEAELPPEPKPDDVVLGGQLPQPRPGDMVRSIQN